MKVSTSAALWAGAFVSFVAYAALARTEPLGAQATPVGITVSPPAGVDMGRRRGSNTAISSLLSDASGMTLYVREADGDPNAEPCADACLKLWPPLAAPARAKPDGDWSVTTRADGFKQWAYKGKPLYRSVKDTQPGEAKGDGVDGQWRPALYEMPGQGVFMPSGVTVRPNARALGDTLIDHRGMTLYTSIDTRDACRAECLASWAPFVAGELAKPVGDWTIAEREDGIRQWVYQGRAVYTFKGDVRSGDALGVLFDKNWQAATVRRYFMPSQVQLRKSGSVITFTTANGLTLYTRDRYIYAPGSFHADGGSLSNISIGRAIGTEPCEGKCSDDWVPFKAAADAQPSGYWSILTRPDGTRQWAYQGYALYTNAKDKKPGEMMGRDVFDLTDGSKAMYWRVVSP